MSAGESENFYRCAYVAIKNSFEKGSKTYGDKTVSSKPNFRTSFPFATPPLLAPELSAD